MNCPNCDSPIEESEFFCGSCGINLKPKDPNNFISTNSDFVEKSLPEYAQLKTVSKISLASYISYLSFVAGIIIALFISPLYGLIAGFVGLISSSFVSKKNHLVHKSIGFSLASILLVSCVGLISYNYSVIKKNQNNNKVASNNFLISSSVNTSCYSFNFNSQLYLSSNNSGCSIEAYNGNNLASSTVFYKILSIENHNINFQNFASFIQPIILQDVKQNLVGFKVVSSKITTFAGNIAFGVTANSDSSNSSVIEEGVYHPSSSTNFFDIIYANNYPNVNLKDLEASWSWKKY